MKKRNGFILPLLIAVILLFLITAPSLINWITTDTTQTIREQRKSIAFNLAQAAVERGYWKVKSSTSTFEAVSMGQILPGYNFDVTYNDILEEVIE
jgi:Tfp pilus assembly protein PilX